MDLEEEYAEVTFWLRAIPVGAASSTPRGGVKTPPYDANQ